MTARMLWLTAAEVELGDFIDGEGWVLFMWGATETGGRDWFGLGLELSIDFVSEGGGTSAEYPVTAATRTLKAWDGTRSVLRGVPPIRLDPWPEPRDD